MCREAGLSTRIKYLTDRSKAVPIVDLLCFFLSCGCYAIVRVLSLLCLCARLFKCTCGHLLGKG